MPLIESVMRVKFTPSIFEEALPTNENRGGPVPTDRVR
jgi:hypothetical protein